MGSDTSYVGKPEPLILLPAINLTGRRSDLPLQAVHNSTMNHYGSHHMKRSRSPDNGSDSCDDDAFSEDMCAVTGSTMMSSSTGGGGGSTRKRRRGVIEKRRRDRINCSLNELKRLVPTALEKSASAKLEKAEILQMTVEHLKTLESTRKNDPSSSSGDSTRFAMDYHGFGFRECAAEVARYLSSVEGLDSQDPLRLRLMSHLQIFAAQRGVVASSPPPPPPPPPHQPPPVAATPHYHAHAPQHHNPDPNAWPHYGSANGYDASKINTALSPGYEHLTAAAATTPAGFFDYFSSPTATSTPSSTRPNSHYTPSLSTSSSSSFSPLSSSASSSSPSPLFSTPNSNGYIPPAPPTAATPAKPYRPWGAEMAC